MIEGMRWREGRALDIVRREDAAAAQCPCMTIDVFLSSLFHYYKDYRMDMRTWMSMVWSVKEVWEMAGRRDGVDGVSRIYDDMAWHRDF